MARDYYEVLGVPRNATQEELQAAYRRLSRSLHPDVNKEPGAEDRFKEVGEAYRVLSDPETRARYDMRSRGGPRPRAGAGARTGPGRGPGGGFGGSGPRGFPGDLGGVDLEDLIGDLFGAGPVPGADQEAELELTLEEAYAGGRRWVTLAGPEGSRGYQVSIPPGVVDGQRIRLAGEGGRGGGDARAGDLYLVVRIAPHPRYRLEGRDLHTELPVTPWEAALGATIPVASPGGEVKVRVPPGSSTGRRLRLRGQGMPNPRGEPGDLYAEVRIHVPSRLRRRERQLFEELSRVSAFDPRKEQR
jgi:curved DNA-binding protein